MSRIAHEFWNHKRIAQSEARARLKALGILTGDEAEMPVISPPPGLVDTIFKSSPLFDALRRGAKK